MKAYEKAAIDHASKYKAWELQCVAKDSYITAYKDALYKHGLTDIEKFLKTGEITSLAENLEVEVEFSDGQHQLIDDIKILKKITTNRQPRCQAI